MNSRSGKSGFTLVEILVAVAIIVAIVSMVYGSYFATSRSAQECRTRIALSGQGRKVLGQMTRQIRCSYVGSAKEYKYPTTLISRQREKIPENEISYFNGNTDEPDGEILHLVTTNSILGGRASVNGLFEVTYKFDKSNRTLVFSEERFVNVPQSVVEKKNWQPIAENIQWVELAFFDGQQWLPKWDFEEKKKLPHAVKINITCEDENFRQYNYGTVAYVCCRKNQGKKTTETLVSINK
jgi:prepilin-type N-terminal cleavage/methylation domain-containing protein